METITYRSTCVACGDELIVTNHGQETHPMGCPDSPLEELQAAYLDAVNHGDDPRIAQLEQALENAGRTRATLLACALAYAAKGWPVFPCRPGTKIPLASCRACREEPKCPGPEACGHSNCHGFKDATLDETTIRAWWRSNPRANIGLATGHTFDVIDVDMPTGTLPWAELRDSNTIGDIHGVVTTPGGMHFYIPATGGGNLTGFRPGLDYRGHGGYVIAPPSTRSEGTYTWSMRPSPHLTATHQAADTAAAGAA